VSNTLPLPTSLAGTTVSVRDSAGADRLAPLFFVAPQQINYLIPPGAATGAATITVTSGDGSLSIGAVNIAAIAPGLFTANANGQGVAAAVALRVKADGAQIYEPVSRFDQAQNRFVALPIDLGPPSDQVFLIMFGTGMRNVSSLAAAALTIGGTNTELLYVGAQGEFVGLDQVTARLPRSLIGRGEIDVALMVDGQKANIVRVAIAGNQTCNYAIAPASQSFSAGASTGSVNVTANSGCAWTASSNAGFITITGGASGNGNGAVNYSVAANTAASRRTGTLTIAGQTFTVTQAPTALFSDSFNRADAGSCALGQADLALGGSGAHYYLPIFAGGANLAANALQNNGLDYGGVQFTAQAATCAGARGESIGQDLNIKVDLLVPTDAAGRITQAGPYLRSRAAAPNDGLIGGASAGYWIQLHSTGEVKVKRLNPQAIVAFSGKPATFNPAVLHTLEIAAQGTNLQVALDGQLLTFNQNGSLVTTVSIPPAWEGPPVVGTNQGAAGIAFGAEDNRGQIGGQRADNLVISPYSSLAGLPVRNNLAVKNVAHLRQRLARAR
jgi:uncharacterized protein (TIGR03437 family)